jgi:hypothetical protein
MAWLRSRLYFRELALICSIAILPGDMFLYGQATNRLKREEISGHSL